MSFSKTNMGQYDLSDWDTKMFQDEEERWNEGEEEVEEYDENAAYDYWREMNRENEEE